MNEMIGNNHIVAEGTTIVMERTFDAPRERVFAAWKNADAIKKWWGPREYPTTYCTVDFRVGGEWHYCMTGPNGEEAWGKSIYLEIVEPERIVYRDLFSDEQGNEMTDMPSFAITVEFREEQGKTRLVSTSQVGSEADVKQLLEMGMAYGAAETWDKLDEMLQAQTA